MFGLLYAYTSHCSSRLFHNGRLELCVQYLIAKLDDVSRLILENRDREDLVAGDVHTRCSYTGTTTAEPHHGNVHQSHDNENLINK